MNKNDTVERLSDIYPFYELGIGELYGISAMHGVGTGDLLDAVVAALPKEEVEEDESVKIAIVGKPNVGKSSFAQSVVR